MTAWTGTIAAKIKGRYDPATGAGLLQYQLIGPYGTHPKEQLRFTLDKGLSSDTFNTIITSVWDGIQDQFIQCGMEQMKAYSWSKYLAIQMVLSGD